MTSRQEQKAASKQAILKIASRRLREGGPSKVGIAAVTKEAGLTHGAFYAHFENKEALTVAALNYAVETNQPRWFAHAEAANTFEERLARLAEYYLSRHHRDRRGSGCVIAALAGEISEASASLKAGYAITIEQTIQKISGGHAERFADSAVFLSSVTGALNLARNTSHKRTSDRILKSVISHFGEG